MPEAAAAAADAQGADAAEAQGAGESTAQGAADGAQGATTGAGTASVEALTAKIRELEKDNATYRKRERDREKAEADRADGEKTEVERLRAQLERATSDLAARDQRDRTRALQMASLAAATRLGYRNPDAATRLLRPDDPELKWSDEGEPTNVEALLTEWAKANPYAVAATDFGGGQRGTSAASGAPNMNDLIRGAAAAKGR